MLNTMPMDVSIRLSNFARLGIWILLLWAWFGLTWSLTSHAWEMTVGFWPVWYGECALCAGPNVLPNSVPLVGGTGVLAVVAIASGVALLTRRLPRRTQPYVQVVAGLAGIGHSAIAFVERYPGPLPQLLVGTLPPLVAAALFFMATFAPRGAESSSFSGALPGPAAIWFLTVSMIAQILLGGLVLIAAIVMGVRAFRRRESMSDSAVLLAGTAHTLIGMGAYYAISNRFAHLVDSSISWIF